MPGPTIDQLQAKISQLEDDNSSLQQQLSPNDLNNNLQWLSDALRKLHHNPSKEVIAEVLNSLLHQLNASGAAILFNNSIIAEQSSDNAAISTRISDNKSIKKDIQSLKEYINDILINQPTIYFCSFDEAPEIIKKSTAAKNVFDYFKIKSFYCISLSKPGDPISYITIDWDKPDATADPKTIEAVLFSIGEAIITVLEQLNSKEKLQKKIDNERWLTENIEILYRSDYPITAAVNQALIELCRLLSAERIFIRHKINQQQYRLSYEYCEKSIPSIIDTVGKDIDIGDLPPEHALIREEPHIISNINNFSTDNRVKNSLVFKNDPVQSTMMLPLFGIDGIQAYMAIDCITHIQHWSAEQQKIAQSLGNAICMAHARQHITQQLIKSKQHFSMAMAASKDALWDWQLDNDHLYMSTSYFVLLGYNPKIDDTPHTAAFIDKHVHPEDHKRYHAEFKKLRNNQTPFDGIKYRLIKKNGEIIWVQAKTEFAAWDKNNKPTRVAGVLTDITHFVEQQVALDDARHQAELANIAKSDFLARMSHEIRTPMNAIIGLSHLAQGTKLSTQQQDYIDHIYDSSTNLLGIINDILDFSKIEADKFEIDQVTFNIEELLQQIIQATHLQAKDKALSIELDYPDTMPRFLRGDRLRLYQIFNNLLSNALKFTQQGLIQLKVLVTNSNKHKTTLEFRVSDTGIGIAEDYIDHLFEPFTQADGSISRRFGGTGLGLTIVHRLIDLMQGSINVESQRGSGTTFILSLSFVTATTDHIDQLNLSKETTEIHTGSLHGLQLLVAEDNIVNQKVAGGILKKRGVICSFANNGREAIELLEAEPEKYDAILMDIEMPEVDGYQASRHIREQLDQHIPIIAMTAHAMSGDEKKALDSGMNFYLTKPINPALLYSSLESLCLLKKEDR